jgi:hypothetical protein
MKGVAVEGNGGHGVHAISGVIQLEGCTVTGNAKGNYRECEGGRIER